MSFLHIIQTFSSLRTFYHNKFILMAIYLGTNVVTRAHSSWNMPGYGQVHTLRKHAYSNILNILHSKKENFLNKKIWYFFSYFCSKHRLWVLVRTASAKHRLWVLLRTASARRFEREPTIYVLSRNKKNNVYPCKPQFYYIKVGFEGGQYIIGMFSWWSSIF